MTRSKKKHIYKHVVSAAQGGLVMFVIFVFLSVVFLMVMNSNDVNDELLKKGLCFFYFLLGCYPMLEVCTQNLFFVQ